MSGTTNDETQGKKQTMKQVINPEMGKGPLRTGRLSISVTWAYLIAGALAILPPFVLIGDPWGVATNLRLYDEIWIMSGGLIGDGDYVTSARPLTWAPFLLAIVALIFAYRVRAHRQVMLGRHFGIPDTVKHQVKAFFYGRGMNGLLPFGPGDLATAKALVKNGAPEKAASSTVFYYRVFEILAIMAFLGIGLILCGWEGVGLPIVYCLLLFCGVSAVIRPLGRFSDGKGFFASLGIGKVFNALRVIGKDPALTTRLFLVSVGALTLELIGLLLLKNALCSGNIGDGEEFLLLADIPVAAYVVALAVASLARIIPFTPGGMGIFEMSMVTVLGFFGADNVEAAACAMLDGFVTNVILVTACYLSVRSGTVPSIMSSWRSFFRQSAHRLEEKPIDDKEIYALT